VDGAVIDFVTRGADLETWCAVGAPLGLGGPYDTEGRHFSINRRWDADRSDLHDQLLSQLDAETSAEATGNAILLAGLPGAGKSTLRRQLQRDHRLDRCVPVDTDDIRELLIDKLQALGRLPVDLEAWRPGGFALTPLELSSTCHREAKHLETRRVNALGISGRPSLLVDTTLSSEEAGRARIRQLRHLGYTHIKCMLVETTRFEAQLRCVERWRRDVGRYFNGIGFGGRYISSSNFDGYFPDGAEQASCVVAYERLRDAGAPDGFDEATRYETVKRNGVLRFLQVE
jgi:hypothetical protein